MWGTVLCIAGCEEEEELPFHPSRCCGFSKHLIDMRQINRERKKKLMTYILMGAPQTGNSKGQMIEDYIPSRAKKRYRGLGFQSGEHSHEKVRRGEVW